MCVLNESKDRLSNLPPQMQGFDKDFQNEVESTYNQ